MPHDDLTYFIMGIIDTFETDIIGWNMNEGLHLE